MARVVVAIDAGTTGVRALAVDERARVADVAYRELTQHFPRPGWVEHDAAEIWDSVRATLAEVGGRLAEAGRHRGRHRHHQPARDAGRLRPLDRAAAAPRHRLAGPAHRGPVRRAHRGRPPPARARHDRPRARPVLQRHQGGLAASPRRPRARPRRPGPLLLHRRHLGAVEPDRRRPRRHLRHRPLQRQPHPAARYGHALLVPRALRPLRRAAAHPPRGAALGRPLRHGRRWATSARRPRSSTASPSRACSATSRPRCSARPASSPAW